MAEIEELNVHDEATEQGLVSAVHKALDDRRLEAVSAALVDLSDPQIGRLLGRLSSEERAVTFRLLPKNRAIAVFEDLDPGTARDLIHGLREESVAGIIADLDPDDRARIVDELPAKIANRLLEGLSATERRMTQDLLGYPADSAGRWMTPEVVPVSERLTAREAINRLRRKGVGAETIYMVPVVGPRRQLLGVVSLRSLLTADPETPVTDVMSEPIAVHTEEDREIAARLIRDHGMIGLPVVDREDRLVGVITVDDAMRILLEEESEDAARAGGTEPLRRPYLTTSIWGVVQSRIVWLLVLIGAATLTVNVLEHFEDTLAEVVALALFIPLLIGTGGNTGAQTVTTVVRAMSIGDISINDLFRVVGRELLTGLLLGFLLALLAGGFAALVVSPRVGLVLGISLVAICGLATSAGAVIPMVAKRVGVDPAVVSAPFITTLVDATGLVIYFLVAQMVLGI